MDRGVWIVGGAAAAAVAVGGLLAVGRQSPASSAAQGRRKLSLVASVLHRRPERAQRLSPAEYGDLMAALRGTPPQELSPSEARSSLGLLFASGAEGPWPWESGDPGGERALAYAVIDAAVALLTTPSQAASAEELANEVGGVLRATIRETIDCTPLGDGDTWLYDHLPFHDPGWPWADLDCDDYTPQRQCECEAWAAERRHLLPPRYHDGALWVLGSSPAETPFDLSMPLEPVPATPAQVLALYRAALPGLGRAMVGRWGHLAGLSAADRSARRAAAWKALDRIA